MLTDLLISDTVGRRWYSGHARRIPLISRKLDRNPLYVQLKLILLELVHSDEFKAGDKFLTEREISERFDVSRVTANKALSSLVNEGLLSIRKGIGTFVTDTTTESRFSGVFTSFTNRALAAGKKPSTVLLRFERTIARNLPTRARRNINAADLEEMIVIERVRLADQVPMILERHYFRSRFVPELAPDDVVVSVYDMLTQKYHITLSEMVETIRTITIKSGNAQLLGVPAGTPGFLMFFMPLDDKGAPVYFAEVIYRGDAYEFHNRLGPIWRSHSTDEDPGDFRTSTYHAEPLSGAAISSQTKDGLQQ
jgi:GntR family transcriptional regulator